MKTYTYFDGTVISGATPDEVLKNLAGSWIRYHSYPVEHFKSTLSIWGLDIPANTTAEEIINLMLAEGILSEIT